MKTQINKDGFETFNHDEMTFSQHDTNFPSIEVFKGIKQVFIPINKSLTKIVYFVGETQFKTYLEAINSINKK